MGAAKGNTNAKGSTLCTPKLLEQARTYVTDYDKHGDAIPSLVGLCKVLGVRRRTFYLWAEFEGDESDPRLEFQDVMDEIKEEQERVALNNGLVGVFNPAITKLVLHNHGYHDKQDSNVKAAFSVNIGDKDADTL